MAKQTFLRQLPLFDDLKTSVSSDHIVNVASVPQLSVFRYPGGKTWFVPHARAWLRSLQPKPTVLIEPFAGGGIVGLNMLYSDLVKHTVFVELDDDIAAVWECILSDQASQLADRITGFPISTQAVDEALERPAHDTTERAFQTILRNRVNRGGILAPGAGRVKTGEKGKGMFSRWYPHTLAKRIMAIWRQRERLTFIHGDGLDVMRSYQERADAAFFIDPPYTAGGKSAGSRLYTHWQLDHDVLFQMAARLVGDVVMTYDRADEVEALANRYGFSTRTVAMKNTHHAQMNELIIGRDFGWLDEGSRT